MQSNNAFHVEVQGIWLLQFVHFILSGFTICRISWERFIRLSEWLMMNVCRNLFLFKHYMYYVEEECEGLLLVIISIIFIPVWL